MRARTLWTRIAPAAGCLALAAASALSGQEATPAAPVPPPPAPAQTVTPIPAAGAAAPLRLSDMPFVRIDRLPADNPFGLNAEMPAALPPKPQFAEMRAEAPLYTSIRVDRAGKATGSRRARDPISSLAAEEKRSFERWTFEPARKSGQPVETWAAFRLDLAIDVRAPKIEQLTLTPVLPSTPIPVPVEWGTDQAWYDSLKVVTPTDGTVPVEQLDTLAVPKKTKWDADSYKGPFSVRVWVHITKDGHVDRTIPIQASDAAVLAAIRRQISGWPYRPARANGQPADSWNELALSGQIGYSTEIKQIQNLRKTLPEGQ